VASVVVVVVVVAVAVAVAVVEVAIENFKGLSQYVRLSMKVL
jgi:hypothetical protein